MYMDENGARVPHEHADGELLRRLLEENRGGDHRGCRDHAMPRGCDGAMRRPQPWEGMRGDRRGDSCPLPRAEQAEGEQGNMNGGCACDHSHSHACEDAQNEIGNPYPCGPNGGTERSLAMVYAPIQPWQSVYEPQIALSRGTLFRELDMPFYGDRKSAKGGNCRGY